MSQEDRDAVERMDMDIGVMDTEDGPSVFDTLPPGDEAFSFSHEGGEYEVFDELAEGLGLYVPCRSSAGLSPNCAKSANTMTTEIVMTASKSAKSTGIINWIY
jgi:hypothetical protein